MERPRAGREGACSRRTSSHPLCELASVAHDVVHDLHDARSVPPERRQLGVEPIDHHHARLGQRGAERDDVVGHHLQVHLACLHHELALQEARDKGGGVGVRAGVHPALGRRRGGEGEPLLTGSSSTRGAAHLAQRHSIQDVVQDVQQPCTTVANRADRLDILPTAASRVKHGPLGRRGALIAAHVAARPHTAPPTHLMPSVSISSALDRPMMPFSCEECELASTSEPAHRARPSRPRPPPSPPSHRRAQLVAHQRDELLLLLHQLAQLVDDLDPACV